MLATALRLLGLVIALAAGSASAQLPTAGALLFAAPSLAERNFAESVVFLVHHDENGSLGVLVNRPTSLEPASVFPEVTALRRYRDTLFLGGPVAPRQLLVLLRAPAAGVLEGPAVVDDVYVSADLDVLGRLPGGRIDAAQVRLYAGHAGWGPGQLEAEIASGDWRVVPGTGELVFAREPLDLWRGLAAAGDELVVARGKR